MIGLAFLAFQILFSNYISPDCNPMDYPYGSREWRMCLLARAEHAKSQYNTISDCEDIPLKTSCYKEVAAKTNNLSLCDMVAELDYATDTEINSCYEEVGIRNNNLEACNKIFSSLEKEDCYSQIAMQTRNKTICEYTRFKDRCIRQAEAGHPVN